MAYTDDEIKWVYKRTAGHCFYCGEHLTLGCYGLVADRGAWDIDDFIPTLNKGERRRENWVPACLFCDCIKRNLFPWEYDSRRFLPGDENPDNYIKK
jgi:hypothetical protein